MVTGKEKWRSRINFEFGRVLRAERKRAGLSQEALAFDAEIDRTYPSLMERGLRYPTIDILFRLARALNVPAAKLVILIIQRLER